MKTIRFNPCRDLFGSVTIPGDKSISHRALMFASLADGTSQIQNLLLGHDCIATQQVMRSLGVHMALEKNSWIITGNKKDGLLEPSSILDCKNSGTTIRLMAGLLSAMPFLSVLDGSEQIKTRPMDRIITPLQKMGANIFGRKNNQLAPLVTIPSKLIGKTHTLLVKSAQVKSALILAGLFAENKTTILNTFATRDHTERLLAHMGAEITTEKDAVVINPLKEELKPIAIKIPGDISSAAFLIVAGVILARNGLVLKDVLVNKTRTGIIDALKEMGARINYENERLIANEPIADLHIKKSVLRGKTFSGNHIVRMIDEIPLLALLATQAEGTTVIKDASELKVKESNRILKTVELLKQIGARIEETNDGMIIIGKTPLRGGQVSSYFDHRLALTSAIAGLISEKPVIVTNAEVTDDSFPGFIKVLTALGANASEV